MDGGIQPNWYSDVPFPPHILCWRANARARKVYESAGGRSVRLAAAVTFVDTDFTIAVFIRSLVYIRENFLFT